ncbi:MAG: GGDEF domain-containing protein [Gammaproteobacteria bacterium]|nr:GGDEF domain-containing protein [Gammaproteobacteria bacterium]
MSGNERSIQESPVLYKVLRLLEDMKASPSGAIIHGHIEQMLLAVSADHRKTEEAYASFLEMMMEACISLIPADLPLHTHLRLVQLRLIPPLSASELSALSRSVEAIADELARSGGFRGRDLAQALSPVVERFGGQSLSSLATSVSPASQAPPEECSERRAASEKPIQSGESVTELKVNTAYREHLDRTREEMQKLHADFVAQMGEAVAGSEIFGGLLVDVLAVLQQVTSTDELDVQRCELTQILEQMIAGQQALDDKFTRAQEYLSIIEDDNLRLSEELDRVRLLSLIDELTRLPNRRAFMRRLEDEVSRVQRHGFPLSLVLVDLDQFKHINDLNGRAVGDEVLRCYSEDVLSIFRHHDLVARYSGEGFAVLLPNTTQEGVVCALQKVRRRLGEVVQARGIDVVELPTFSAGVAQFQAGETMSRLVERADSALYAAKHKGRGVTEVAGFDVEKETPQLL